MQWDCHGNIKICKQNSGTLLIIMITYEKNLYFIPKEINTNVFMWLATLICTKFTQKIFLKVA